MTAVSKKIAFSGILAAIAIITLYIESIVPSGRLGFLTLTSLYTAAVIIECGIKTSLLYYAAVSVISFIIVPDKMGVIPYIAFFGIYAVIKHLTEKQNNVFIEYVVKFIYFNICLGAFYILARELILGNINLPIPIWTIFIIFEIVFLIYDYVLSRLIWYYTENIKKRIKH